MTSEESNSVPYVNTLPEGTDSSKQMHPVEEAVNANELLDDIEELLQFGTWQWDATTGKVTWSDGMYQIMGYDKSSTAALVSDDFYLSHLDPFDAEELRQARTQGVATKTPFESTYRVNTHGNGQRVITTRMKFVLDDDGKVVKGIAINRDVTRLKEYEKELEIKVMELNRSNLELQEFAYVASHDLQEPLRKLSTFGERLRNRSVDQLSEEGIVYLNRMMASAESMRVLIDNLLEFSRVTRIQHPFIRGDMNAVLKEVLEELDLSIEEAQASISVHPLPAIAIMPLQIKQLFNNLITNALKFRKPDVPVQIVIHSEKLSRSDIEKLTLRTGKTYYKITVTDNGIGFEELYAERIFQLFQRLHGKAEYPGSGIGLAICRKIADNHQGMITAASVPGQGATFTIVLPEKQSS